MIQLSLGIKTDFRYYKKTLQYDDLTIGIADSELMLIIILTFQLTE